MQQHWSSQVKRVHSDSVDSTGISSERSNKRGTQDQLKHNIQNIKNVGNVDPIQLN